MEEKIANNPLEENIENGMEVTLYLMKDDFPAIVVKDLHRLIDRLDGFKMSFDFKAFVMIEFVNKNKMEAAKEAGFEYTHNGQVHHNKYASVGRVMEYVKDNLPPNHGKGF